MASIETFIANLAETDGRGALRSALPVQFDIGSAGPYPLAKHVPIEGSTDGGELLISFEDISFGPVAVLAIEPGPTLNEVTVTLAPARFEARYTLFGLEMPRIELDTGGALQSLAAMPDQAAAAPPGRPGEISQRQFAQLVQAQEQRARLNETPNGRLLLEQFAKYNDVYNDAFSSNQSLRKAWAAGGATSQMADHTSDSLSGNQVVNPDGTLFGEGADQATYNEHAFSQQLNLYFAVQAKDHNAANAVFAFGDQVKTTGNTQSDTVPMTGEAVYQAVNSPPAGGVTPAAMSTPGPHPLHAPLARLAANTHNGEDLETLAAHGYLIDAAAVQRFQEIHGEAVRLEEPGRHLEIAAGLCVTALGATGYKYRLTGQPDGAITAKLTHSTLSLAGLEIDTAGWPGTAGDVARERLWAADFMRGILEDRLTSQLTRVVRALAMRSG